MHRGFLHNYPSDVVLVINGKPTTRQDILADKRERQVRQMAAKRRSRENKIKPCFIWVFYNNSDLYGGWWLYVKTLRQSWQISSGHAYKFILPIMELFPCGYLPIIRNFRPWMATFAETYPWPTRKRPDRQGMALARAVISPGGWLVEVKGK